MVVVVNVLVEDLSAEDDLGSSSISIVPETVPGVSDLRHIASTAAAGRGCGHKANNYSNTDHVY